MRRHAIAAGPLVDNELIGIINLGTEVHPLISLKAVIDVSAVGHSDVIYIAQVVCHKYSLLFTSSVSYGRPADIDTYQKTKRKYDTICSSVRL